MGLLTPHSLCVGGCLLPSHRHLRPARQDAAALESPRRAEERMNRGVREEAGDWERRCYIFWCEPIIDQQQHIRPYQNTEQHWPPEDANPKVNKIFAIVDTLCVCLCFGLSCLLMRSHLSIDMWLCGTLVDEQLLSALHYSRGKASKILLCQNVAPSKAGMQHGERCRPRT